MLTKREQRRSDACDVVVVGAGLVGAAVAVHLTREGFDTAILEARRVSGGATGRSAGMVLVGLPAHYSWAASVYGRQRARQLWTLTAGGRNRLIRAAERLRIPVEHTGSLALAVDDEEVDMLWESAKLLREDGFDASFTLTDPLDRGFPGALHHPRDVMVDPAALTRALLAADGVVVHEGTEVYALEPAGDDIRVWAHRRTVLCRRVVLAVDGYAALLHPTLATNVGPVNGYVCTVEPPDDVLHGQPCTFGHGKGFLCPRSDGQVVVGGWSRQSRGGQGPLGDGAFDLASRYFPELELEGLGRRSEVVGFTPDGLPLVGALPDIPQAYFAVGFGGRGLSWAFIAAERLVEAMLNGADLGILSAGRLEEE